MVRKRPAKCKPARRPDGSVKHYLPERRDPARKVTHRPVTVEEFFATINRIRESKTIRCPDTLPPRRTPATSAPRQVSVNSAKSMETPA